MKKSLALLCVVLFVTEILYSCKSDNFADNMKNKRTISEQITSPSQKEFVIMVDSISQTYKKTRGISQADVSSASRKVLVGVVADGIGSVIGSGFVSIVTGFVASTAYDSYLSWVERQMSRTLTPVESNVKDINKDPKYNSISDSLKFVFSDNNPKNMEDSIGFMHNLMLNEVNLMNHTYSTDYGIDYDKLMDDAKNIATDIGYSCNQLDSLDARKIYAFYAEMNNVLIRLPEEHMSDDDAFFEIACSLEKILGKEKSVFISALSKSVFSYIGQNVDLQDITLYSNELNSVLKDSNLSDNDKTFCKKLFQVMVCSYAYWKCLRGVQ